MAKSMTSAEIGVAIADQIIGIIDRKTGPKVDKAAAKTILMVVSGRLMTYFLMRRL